MVWMYVECSDGPWKETVFQSVCSGFYASVPPPRGKQAEQPMSRVVHRQYIRMDQQIPLLWTETSEGY